jgi:glycine cleavage system H protein
VADHEIPEDLRFSAEHEWARIEGDRVVIGVTDYAQQQLGDIVFVELPEVGSQVEQGAPLGVIESVKAVSDLYAPVSGEVLQINTDIEEHPEFVNRECYSDGWLLTVRLSDPAELDALFDARGYREHLDSLSD